MIISLRLKDQSKNNVGWNIKLINNATLEGERNIFESTLFAGSLLVPTLTPSGDLCLGGGQSALYCINPFTGCACSAKAAGVRSIQGILTQLSPLPVPPPPVGSNSSSGGGKAIGDQQSSFLYPTNPNGKPTALDGIQSIPNTSGRMSWREIVGQ